VQTPPRATRPNVGRALPVVFVVAVALTGASRAAAAPTHPFGVTLEAGAPDLVGLRLTVRPRGWLRLNVGPVTDLFSAGVSGGVTVVPLRTLVSPSLTIDGGYLFDGDTHGIPRALGLPFDGRASYGFVDGHLGLEVGANRRACFFLHAGVSYLDLTAHGGSFEAAHLKVWGPSAKLGLTVYL